MLTRAQVAHRLGKSIATVRRLEGSRLHPRRDAAGIHRFDPGEVARLAAELALPGSGVRRRAALAGSRERTLAQWPHQESISHSRLHDDDEQFSAVVVDDGRSVRPAEATELVARVRELEQRASESKRALTEAKRMAEQQQAAIVDVIQTLMSLSDRELRCLPDDVLEHIAAVLGQAAASW